MADAAAEEALPLENTAKKRRVDTSVDTSATQAVLRDAGTAYSNEANASTQAAAGQPIPETVEQSNTSGQEGTRRSSDPDKGIEGPVDALDDGDVAGADAALQAAHLAKKQGRSEDAVLDALEDAERRYEAAQDAKPGSLGQLRSTPSGAGPEGAGPVPTGGLSSPRRSNSGSAPKIVDEATRQKVRQRLVEALRKNSQGAVADAEAVAAECEAACHASSSSRTSYFNKVSNAARVAASVASAEELLRVANGVPREVAEGTTASQAPMTQVAGLQGFVNMDPAKG